MNKIVCWCNIIFTDDTALLATLQYFALPKINLLKYQQKLIVFYVSPRPHLIGIFLSASLTSIY